MKGLNSGNYNRTVDPRSSVSLSTAQTAVAGHGLGNRSASATFRSSAIRGDADEDGLQDVVDSDNDNNGVPDNYDPNSNDRQSLDSTTPNFLVFSNFKLPIDQSLNLHTTGLDTSRIDTALQSIQSLAIGVAGDSNNSNLSVELNCTGLNYCSAGGTGSDNNVTPPVAFPGSAGGTYDPDGDGFGTISRGPTGDFQLLTGATSSTIAAGDVLTEIVTDSSNETVQKTTSMLNFVFVSNPAIKTVTTSLGTNSINYAQTPILGSGLNCINVAASGTVAITIEGYRPQRPGEASVGEGTWVDIGNSLIVIDIPNAPVNTISGSGSAGPGNCRAASYTTSDSNLQTTDTGLQDRKGDQDASSSNSYTFSIDVTDCLNGAQGGAISWNSGQYLFLDLQFKSNYGDNSAQKFCLVRQ